MTQEEKPLYLGHRERLRNKLLQFGPDSMPDYELLELLLMTALPRCDVKPLAKRLLNKFQTVTHVLQASPEELMSNKGIKETTVATLKIVPALAERMLRVEMAQAPVFERWDHLIDYCTLKLANKTTEHFCALFLNAKCKLLADEELQHGTVDRTPVYPREILVRALNLNASYVVLVHNHPSGDSTPSDADLKITQAICTLLHASGVIVFDHLIIGKHGIYSFKNHNLIPD